MASFRGQGTPVSWPRRTCGKLGIDWVSFGGRQFPVIAPRDPGEHYEAHRRQRCTRRVRQNPESPEGACSRPGDLVLPAPITTKEPDAPSGSGTNYEILTGIRAELRSNGGEGEMPIVGEVVAIFRYPGGSRWRGESLEAANARVARPRR